MTVTKLRPSFTFTEDRLAELRVVLPEAFADGKINWGVLREVLGEYLEDDAAEAESFGLSWPGKRQARRLVAMPSKGTLVPVSGEGVNEETTRNIFIEGDNLEVLKLLQKSYAGQVKMIYIDPPYNTGNDFVYRDNFREPLEDYLRRTGQLSETGEMLTSNPRASGRFHSNWLSMMYPRLRAAKNLLRPDGAIFISIDDTELSSLGALMNEIYGEEAFAGTFVWQSKKGGGSDNEGLVRDQEYVVCYSKQGENVAVGRIELIGETLDKSDSKGPYRRGRELNKWGSNSRREDRPTMYFPIPGPSGEIVYPIRNDGTEGCWRWGRKKMMDIAQRGDVEFVKRPDGTYIVYEKVRSTDVRTKPYRTWLTDVGTTADGSKEVKELFDGKKVYDFPKPTRLLKHLVSIGTRGEGDIVLDFFAGSCSTAHAVLELNRSDSGERSFVCVQFPEPTPDDSEARKAGYVTVSAVGKERIRRILTRLNASDKGKLSIADGQSDEDLGFRVLSLERSSYKGWLDYNGDDPQQLELLFEHAASPLVDGWVPEHVLTEIQLIEGFPLDCTVTEPGEYKKNKVLRVESDACAHRLFVCLDKKVKDDTLERLQLEPDDVFICLDSALTDEAKVRLGDHGNLRVI